MSEKVTTTADRQDTGLRAGGQLAPWLLSSAAASVVPFGLLLLHKFVPATRAYLSLGGRRDFEHSLFVFCCGTMRGCCSWLQGASLTFLWSTTITYWVLGWILAFPTLRRSFGTGRISFTLAVALLLFVAPMLSTIWVLALKNGLVHLGPWELHRWRGGPWRYNCNLRWLARITWFFPLYALVFGLLSNHARPSAPAKLVAAGSVIVFFCLFWCAA